MDRQIKRWVYLEIHLLAGYTVYWEQRTKAAWLLKFNTELCLALITWYEVIGLPYRPPTFNPFYVRMCHRYMRWREIK